MAFTKFNFLTDDLILAPREVHLWSVSVTADSAVNSEQWVLLSADEQARAKVFHFERDRVRYIITRSVLRQLLGHYLGKGAAEIRFVYSHHGKPEIAASDNALALQFNVSHSRDMILLAFCQYYAIGVDVEYVRFLADAEQMSDRFFAKAEAAIFKSVSPEQQPEAFFNCWTRKEAFIKAIGHGLAYPLHQFQVTLRPGEEARLLSIANDVQLARQWSMASLDLDEGYKAAVIVQTPDFSLLTWQWSAI